MKLPFLSVRAMEEDDLTGRKQRCGIEEGGGGGGWGGSHLHVHPSVVDEILERVSARVVVLELCVVGDGADGGVVGSDHPADVDWLDVGEVGEYSRPRCTGGLRSCSEETRWELTCSGLSPSPRPPTLLDAAIQTMKLLPQAFPSLMGKLNLTTGGATDVSSVPWQSELSRLRMSRLPLYPV